MISSSYANRLIEMPLTEIRLVSRAKSGEVKAFVELYDSHVERVYRYIHFLAPNNAVAEGLTFQVFARAWEQLDRYQIISASFVLWLYGIAQKQVTAYCHTHKNSAAPDNEFTLAARGGRFREEFQAIRDGLKFLTTDQQHFLILKFIVRMSHKDIARLMTMHVNHVRVLQMHSLSALAPHLMKTDSRTITKGFQQILEDCLMRISSGASTLDDCLLRYPKHSAQLEPLLETVLLLDLGRDVAPLPTFTAFTHDALIHYLKSHPRQRQISLVPTLRRTALAFAMLVIALLITGTAHAQSALPGDAFYPWKRASEQAWHAVSPNPLATDIFLAERRLDEWIAVANDPTLSVIAMINYQEALSTLKSTDANDLETLILIASVLQSQQEVLAAVGLFSAELDNYLIEIFALLPGDAHPQGAAVEILPTAETVVSPTTVSANNTMETCVPECADVTGNASTDAGDDNAGGIDDGSGNNAGGNGQGLGIGVGGGNAGGNGQGLGIGIGGGNAGGNSDGSDNGGGNDDKGEKDNNGHSR